MVIMSNQYQWIPKLLRYGTPWLRYLDTSKARLLLSGVIVMVSSHLYSPKFYSNYIPTAWVMGASDPTSGTVSLREIVRGFGTLLKKGWKPLRTSMSAF